MVHIDVWKKIIASLDLGGGVEPYRAAAREIGVSRPILQLEATKDEPKDQLEYGGVPSTDEGGVKYVLSDWQGSTRAILSNSGFVNARLDYTAFGEEINAGVGLRTAAQGFGSSNDLRQKFGLTQRDEATGLDHTTFRKNENQAGRWTSPDLYKGSIALGNSQSFNRYSYVNADPVNFVDPSGLFARVALFCAPILRSDNEGNFWYVYDCFEILVGDGGHWEPEILDAFPLPNDPYLEFDGCDLKYIDENGNVARSWKAYSGVPGTTREQQRIANRGPIPEATYRVGPSETQDAIWFLRPSLQGIYPPGIGIPTLIPVYRPWANTPGEHDAWGDYRTPIVPVSGDTYGRSNFYLHGGTRPGSIGCIDLVSGNNDFHKWFKQNRRDLTLNVKYTCNPWT